MADQAYIQNTNISARRVIAAQDDHGVAQARLHTGRSWHVAHVDRSARPRVVRHLRHYRHLRH
jgi:hypothetical protein